MDRDGEAAMDHWRAGQRPARTGPADWFTGEVTLSPVVEAPAPARLRVAMVTFAPGARTNWHRHPLGQTLFVLSGRGRAQTDGGPVIDLAPGDTVWFAPGERHWHGAAPDAEMVHLAMQEADETGSTTWWEDEVSDEAYRGG
jgi:quercetin dioxygenase-like cupin family protein